MKDETSMLQQELRQRRPFRSKAQESVAGIRRTADVIFRTAARLFEPFGVTDQQYNVLRILRGAHPETLSTREIGERMIEQQPNVTRLLDRLEAKGFVHRQRSTEDRRVVYCGISDAGLELLTTIDEPFDRVMYRLMRNLTEDEQRQLISLLERVRAAEAGVFD